MYLCTVLYNVTLLWIKLLASIFDLLCSPVEGEDWRLVEEKEKHQTLFTYLCKFVEYGLMIYIAYLSSIKPPNTAHMS